MKKLNYIPIFSFFFFQVALFAQTETEKKIILDSYDQELIEETKEYLEAREIRNNLLVNKLINEKGYSKTITLSNGKSATLMRVVNDTIPIYYTTDNEDAAKTTRTNFLHTGGGLNLDINGENMIIGVWDGGVVLKTHVEFQNENNESSVTTPSGGTVEFHATHVAGTIIAKGVDPEAKGMAPKATLISHDWTSDESEVLSAATTNSLLISNHSYGTPVENSPAWYMGAYSSDARAWDLIAVTAPYYLMVTSAGNNGSTNYTGGLASGYDKLTGNKNSKNNLVVGNSMDAFVGAQGQLLLPPNMNAGSSQGPSDDGRIKPDITGNGTDLLSTSHTSNNSYAISSGTSMSSPNVAGSLLLLQQYYNELNDAFMLSSTLKGLACHTADDIGEVGPDARTGWGLLNMKRAAETITQEQTSLAIIEQITLLEGDTYSITVTASTAENLEATICWTDKPGTAVSNELNSPTPALVNDLDIRIKRNDETFFPWKLDLNNGVSAPAVKGDNIVDNVEKVQVENPVNTSYTIEVTHKGSLSGGFQTFSLIATGIETGDGINTPKFEKKKFVVWPNPTTDYLNIITDNTTDISSWNAKVYDLQGRVVIENSEINGKRVDISTLQQGMYILKLTNGSDSFEQRIIKQ